MTSHRLDDAPPTDPTPGSDPPSPTPPEDRSRAGAVWVTALGAFLLFAAAGVFVAVQWDHIPDALKLAVLGAFSGGCLLAGRRLRPTLPAAGSVLYHLGAFLLPVLSAAVAVNQHADWPVMLLVEGAVATGAFWVLNRVERSVVLDWATVAATVVLAGGIGACTPVPAPVALVAAAAAAEARRRHGAAIALAALVGLTPLAGLAAAVLPRGSGVLTDLGLAGATSHLVAVGVGLAATAVLAVNAHRRRDLLLVVLAGAAAALGLMDGWVAAHPGPAASIAAAAALFLLLEVLAAATSDDPFWARPTDAVARATELVVGVLTGAATVAVVASIGRTLTHRHALGTDAVLLAAGLIAAAGWFVADLRRRQHDRTPLGIALLTGAGWAPATIGLSMALVVGVAAGTGSALAAGATALLVGIGLTISGRPAGPAIAVGFAIAAPLAAAGHPAVAGGFALVGATTVAAAALVRSPLVDDDLGAQEVWLLGVASTLPVLSAGLVAVDRLPLLATCLGAVATLWITGLVLDRGERRPWTTGLGLVPRAASALTLVAAPQLGATGLAVVAATLTVLTFADAVARRRPWMALASATLAPVAVAACISGAGGTLGQMALGVVMLAPLAGLADGLADDEWLIVTRALAGISVMTAALLAGNDRAALATVLVVMGATGLFFGLRTRLGEVGWIGGLLLATGTWLHLLDHGVRATEPYLAPVALGLLIAGWQARRSTPISSWVAYGPAVALLGGSALVERLAGGGAPHALVAGGVGLAAVIAGGRHRLIAPLLVGTGLLVALTVNESLAVTAGVPTWAWLALGGVTLVGVGISMERAETGPLETGRRVVDVVGEQFS